MHVVGDRTILISDALTAIAFDDETDAVKIANDTQPPTDLGTVVSAIFDDTCGNLIQIVTPEPTPEDLSLRGNVGSGVVEGP